MIPITFSGLINANYGSLLLGRCEGQILASLSGGGGKLLCVSGGVGG